MAFTTTRTSHPKPQRAADRFPRAVARSLVVAPRSPRGGAFFARSPLPSLLQKPQPLHRDPHFVSSDPQNRELTSPYLVSSGCSRASPDHPPRLLFPQAPRRWLSLFPSSAGAFFGPSDGSPGRRRQQMRPLAQPTACIPPDSPLTRVRRLACGVPAALPLSARPPCSTPLRAASPL